MGESLQVLYGGVAVQVPGNQISELAKLPGVAAVQANELHQPTTDSSPDFIGAPGSLFGYIPLDAFGVAPIPVGDEQALNFNMPAFVYGGLSYNRLGVTSDGYLVVGGTNGAADIQFDPTGLFGSPARPNNVLAPFWTDLNGTGTPGILITVLTDGLNS